MPKTNRFCFHTGTNFLALSIFLLGICICHAFIQSMTPASNLIKLSQKSSKYTHVRMGGSNEKDDDSIVPLVLDSSQVAEVLANSLPFIMEYSGQTIVIKYGGHAMTEAKLKDFFAKDIVLLKQCGVNPVIVHGGGPQIAAMLKKLQIESNFVEGLRVTDEDTVQVAEMVLSGSINKEIVNCIKRAGGRAVGISGKDDNLIIAEKLEKVVTDPNTGLSTSLDLGFVGEPTVINTKLINDLVDAGIIPVIAPVGVTREGQTLNINADTSAGAIAGALQASRLLLLTDVSGVLDKEGNLIKELSLSDVIELKSDGTITGGMIPKLNTATGAVQAGAEAAVIMDGRVPHAILLELFTPGGSGTRVA